MQLFQMLVYFALMLLKFYNYGLLTEVSGVNPT